MIAATSETSCQVILPNLNSGSTNPSCYGPALDYEYHLDGTGNATGQLPTGDLGIGEALGTGGSIACSAEKMNSEISSIATKVDTAILFSASMNCSLAVDEQTLPAVGASIDVTTLLNTAIQANNSTTTITSATLARENDTTDGDPVYLYTIASTDTGSGNTITGTTYLKHIPTATDNSTYKGKIWGSFSGTTGGFSNTFAFSLHYEKVSTAIRYLMMSANYPN